MSFLSLHIAPYLLRKSWKKNHTYHVYLDFVKVQTDVILCKSINEYVYFDISCQWCRGIVNYFHAFSLVCGVIDLRPKFLLVMQEMFY